ncbi:MAG: hypothetical protein H8E90_02070 [Anaerolineales bacterium]|nr:hypothetical protein [Anaerolineales bacterium]
MMLRGTTLFGLQQALSPPAATVRLSPSASSGQAHAKALPGGLPVAPLTVGLRSELLW